MVFSDLCLSKEIISVCIYSSYNVYLAQAYRKRLISVGNIPIACNTKSHHFEFQMWRCLTPADRRKLWEINISLIYTLKKHNIGCDYQ